jgi:hypothetical protein
MGGIWVGKLVAGMGVKKQVDKLIDNFQPQITVGALSKP